MIDILKMGFKLLLFAILLAAVGTFLNFLTGLIPPVNLNGCMGYYMNELGILMGLRLFLSIVLYAFAVKFAINYFSGYLN